MTNPNDPAYPDITTKVYTDYDGEKYSCTFSEGGLTKREALAMANHAAILRAAAFNRSAEEILNKAGVIGINAVQGFLAHLAVDAADALIAELNRSEK